LNRRISNKEFRIAKLRRQESESRSQEIEKEQYDSSVGAAFSRDFDIRPILVTSTTDDGQRTTDKVFDDHAKY
jgi:hypothetical protein